MKDLLRAVADDVADLIRRRQSGSQRYTPRNLSVVTRATPGSGDGSGALRLRLVSTKIISLDLAITTYASWASLQ